MARVQEKDGTPTGAPQQEDGRTPAAAATESSLPATTAGDAATKDAPQAQSIELLRLQNERALEEFHDPFASVAAYRHFQVIANTFASSQFVPDHFRNKPNDCLIAMNIAKRMGEDPLMVIQNMFVVKGTPGFKTAFMIARANRNAGFRSSIRWTIEEQKPEFLEDAGVKYQNLRVTAWTLDRFGEKIEATVDTAMAIGEKWTSSPKYKSLLRHMLMWRSAAFLVRLYCPEVMLGYSTVDELEDMVAAGQIDGGTGREFGTAALLQKIAGENAAKAPGLSPVIDVTPQGAGTPEPGSPAVGAPAGAEGTLFAGSGT